MEITNKEHTHQHNLKTTNPAGQHLKHELKYTKTMATSHLGSTGTDSNMAAQWSHLHHQNKENKRHTHCPTMIIDMRTTTNWNQNHSLLHL